MKERAFADWIVEFYRQRGRSFPWRRGRDPYVVLISEIMLRKTTARQASALFEAFFSKYPSPKELAQADEKELRELLKPLGMENKRSKELAELGKVLVGRYGGKVPKTMEELLGLPGVGKYTASAVMCLAYGHSEAMLDANAVRVITRYFDFKSPKKRPREDPALWGFAKSLIPPGRCREFNLGLLDFASAVCRKRKPRCGECPLRNRCAYYRAKQSR